jgi:hypothetical protein
MQEVTTSVSLQVFCRMYNVSFLFDCMLFFFSSHTISPNDAHPSPASRYKTFKVFLIYFLKRQNSSTIQSYAKRVAFHEVFIFDICMSKGYFIIV